MAAKMRTRPAIELLRLKPEQLRLTPDVPTEPGRLDGIAGQDRAREAIAFGLRVAADGYNIAVAGAPASGRNRLVRELMEQRAASQAAAPDWLYAHNFGDARRPRIFRVAPGIGQAVATEFDVLVEACRNSLPAAFANEAYEQKAQQALAPVAASRDSALEGLQRQAAVLGFAINATPMGLVAMPLGRDGRPMSPEAFASLPAADREPIEARGERVQALIAETLRSLRRLEADARERIRQVDADVTRMVVGPIVDDLQQRFDEVGLGEHLEAMEADIVQNAETFKRFATTSPQELPQPVAQQLADEREGLLQRYRVNLFVTHSGENAKRAPIISEDSPTFFNLFGRIEFENRMGALATDFLHIRPGAVHQANGGYLVLQAPDLLADPRSWPRLKHVLKTGEVRMDEAAEHLGLPIVSLAPMPMPLSLKVVLVGPPLLFALLDAMDPEFHALFKVRAEFEPDVPADSANTATYAAFVRQTAESCGLLPFETSAIQEVVRYGSRLAGRQDRLSTRLGLIGDLCTEANQFALETRAEAVTGAHVEAAASARARRSGLMPDRIRKLIGEGTLHVATTGTVVGQVNGLAVFATGDHMFGLPVRITCRTSAGQQGVVAIERETERSGAIHTKGVLVLNGYLMGTFGRALPLAFNASLTFEQSYDEVEGDSASSAELYAILTSLADLPVRQDIAVTGSVDQFGNVQAVGGVTEKVEGFFDVCRETGLTGSQGVMLPATNIRNLALRADVVAAVQAGRFHLWGIARVEEGLEILTGMRAAPAEGGSGRGDTVFERAAATLAAMRESAAATSAGNARNDGASERRRR
jgi:predicted ATP-dependent protease